MTHTTPVHPARTTGWLNALRASLVFILLCGGLYPLFVVTVGGLLFPHQATGSMIQIEGVTVGSRWVGQAFHSPGYFHGRPSAAGHDPFAVGGSNLAVSNPELRERVRTDAARIAAREGVEPTVIPVDLLAASGSGIDPHISPAAARLQAARIAATRELPLAQVQALIERHTLPATFGIFGQPRVNVLMLNLALDGKEPAL